MAKLFFKTSFSIFLWLLLLVNLIYWTNFNSNIGLTNPIFAVDYSTKYFGFSSFLDYFQNIGNWSFLKDVATFKDRVFNIASMLLRNDYYLNLDFDIDNIGEFFALIGNLLLGVITSLFSIFVYVFGVGTFVFYIITMIIGVFLLIAGIFKGYVYKDIPDVYHLRDSIMLMKDLIMI